MQFDNQKKNFFAKLDKSKKGSVDKEIIPLVYRINKNPDYYTTSSCSGRIVLIAKKSEKKQEASWLFVSHKKIKLKDAKNALKDLPSCPVWFRFELLILHVSARTIEDAQEMVDKAARTIEDAQEMVDKARAVGFKRTGIQSTKNKIIVEAASTEVIDAIIADKGKMLVKEDYLNVLVNEANKKLEKNKKKIKRFMALI